MVIGGYFVRPGETPMVKVNSRIDPPICYQILAKNTLIMWITVYFSNFRFIRWLIFRHIRIEKQCGILKLWRHISSSTSPWLKNFCDFLDFLFRQLRIFCRCIPILEISCKSELWFLCLCWQSPRAVVNHHENWGNHRAWRAKFANLISQIVAWIHGKGMYGKVMMREQLAQYVNSSHFTISWYFNHLRNVLPSHHL